MSPLALLSGFWPVPVALASTSLMRKCTREGSRPMCAAVIEGYRAGRLSHRQVGQMLELDYGQTEAFFKEHGVPVNYSAEDLEADRGTLDKILSFS